MKNLFYLSSSGSMATKWLSELLSSSDSIQCFHGSNGLQETYDPQLTLESALDLIEQWALENHATHAGLTHLSGNHGGDSIEYCHQRNVSFCALVRNPILATDSQYETKLKQEVLSEGKLATLNLIVRSIPGLSDIMNVQDRTELIFLRCTQSVIRHLITIEQQHCPTFKFEHYTTDVSQVEKIVRTITKGEISEDQDIKLAFSNLGKLNRHRSIEKDYEATWATHWSDKQREIFISVWRYYLAFFNQPYSVNYPKINNL